MFKQTLLYAPALLLTLSVACGTSKDKKSASETAPAPAANASANLTVSSSVTPLPVLDPAIAATPIPSVANLNELPIFSDEVVSNVVAPNAAGTPASTPVAAETTAPEATTVVGEVPATPFATTSITLGNPVIDGLCNKTFASLETYNPENMEPFKAIGLKAAENQICLTQLKSYSKKVIEDLVLLQRPFTFRIPVRDEAGRPIAGQTNEITLHKNWNDFYWNDDAINTLGSYLSYYYWAEDLYELPSALEEVEVTKFLLAQAMEVPEASRTAEDIARIAALELKLDSSTRTLTNVQTRFQKYVSLMNVAPLAQGAYFLEMILADLAGQPVAPAEEPTSPSEPGAGEPAPSEPVTPVEPAVEPEQPGSPDPAPAPSPAPDPSPAPAPGPVA